MQKVLRRAALADRQATRRLAKRTAKADRDFRNNRREQETFNNREAKKMNDLAKKTRREQWELGPLAPRRDIGDNVETYGTLPASRLRGQELTEKEREEVLAPFGGKLLNIVAGDRVVLLEGRDKGKIGRVSNVDRDRAEVAVEGLNMVDIAVPKWMMLKEEASQPIRSMPKPMPITSVRLVHALHDPDTGLTRDVIVRHLVNTKIWQHKTTGRVSWQRMIPGLDEIVPWPKSAPKEHRIHDVDTIRADVELRTYVPTLFRPPMPASVVDELRNKFSKFRVRHDEDYILRKEAEEVELQATRKLAAQMLTPIQEANQLAKKQRKDAAKAKAGTGKNKRRKELLISLGQQVTRQRTLRRQAAREQAAETEPQLAA